MLRAGEVRNQAELAEVAGLTRARVTQVMNLLCLAPEIVEYIEDLYIWWGWVLKAGGQREQLSDKQVLHCQFCPGFEGRFEGLEGRFYDGHGCLNHEADVIGEVGKSQSFSVLRTFWEGVYFRSYRSDLLIEKINPILLLRDRSFEPVLLVYSRLGAATPGQSPKAPGLRLEAVE